MKSFTFKTKLGIIALIAGFVLFSNLIYSQAITVNDGSTNLNISENTYNVLGLENTVSEIKSFKVKSEHGDFSQIRIEGYGYSMNNGEPKLPVIKKMIEIPLDAETQITIAYQSYKDFNLADFGISDPIFPVQPSVSKSIDDPSQIPFEYDESVYNTDVFYGNRLVEVVTLGIMRGVKLARLEISPVQYNPVQQIIRVYDELRVNITFDGANVQETIDLKEKGNNPYFNGIARMLFNYKPLRGRELFQNVPVTYIMVSDPMFEDAMQPFIEWKTKKGFKVVEAYTNDPNVGTTTASIKSYLQDFYDNPPAGYNPQTFVLFVGDIDQIPSFTGNAGGHVTDLYFCEYTNDLYPEAYYGRFSANNLSELQPQIDKTLEYERYEFPDPSFLDNVVMVAGADGSHQMTWGNGQINYGTEYYFNEAHGLNSFTYLQPEPGGGNYSQNIRQNISDGVSFANYTAHCGPSGWSDPQFNIGHIPALTNANMYPLMIGNCCSSVEFQIDCFGEEILRAENKGALGYIGGSNSTYWDEDYWWGVGFESISANPPYNPDHLGAYDRIFHDQAGITLDDWYISQGQVCSAGNLAVTQAGGAEEYYWEIYHLMGDPSVMIYFSQPPDVSASYSNLMPLSTPTFTVNSNPYSYVSITKDGVFHGAAMADGDGVAEVIFDEPITVPGEADVVITGQNLKPYFGTLVVASPDGPYVLLDEFEINDVTLGNGNGMMDYGESLNISVTMKNLGSELGEDVLLTLTCTDDYITIDNGVATLGDIDPNEIVTLVDAFAITVAEDIPDMHSVAFELEATDGTDSWPSNFSIKGHAPVLEFADFMINDINGNNNGKIDPGETVEIMIYLENTGSADAYNVMGELTTGNMYLTVLTTDPQNFGNIGPAGNGTAVFEASADINTPPGHLAILGVDVTADMGISGEGEFSVVIGQIPVLIVDLDENNNSASEMQASIDELGVSSELLSAFPVDLNLYSSIFVCLGIYSDNYVLSDSEGQALADYLDNSGMLYMEGGDTWFYDDQTAVHGMFGINGVEDGSGDLGTIAGVNGTITEGFAYNYTGDNSWIDHLEATGEGLVIFNNQSPAYACAVSNDAGSYKTVGASFEFGGLVNRSTKTELMEQYLEFFEIIGNVVLSCNMHADPGTICQGEASQFSINVFGGSGNYEYLWEPETGLSDPTIANPVANPEETINYTVTITDQMTLDQITDQMTLLVNETPETPEISQIGENLVSNVYSGNQWYNGNGMIAGANGQIFSPVVAGNYYTIVSNGDGCVSQPSNVIFYQPTNIQEIGEEASFNIYPNPAKDFIFIEFMVKNDNHVNIGLFNAFGQKLDDIEETQMNRVGLKTMKFNTSLLKAGVYYIKMQSDNFSFTRKIILSN
nr:T9SS type A sorting domain-containing protein [Bacteroidota bacterium]